MLLIMNLVVSRASDSPTTKSSFLVRLDVSENSLTGTIPSEFGLLTSLSKLRSMRSVSKSIQEDSH